MKLLVCLLLCAVVSSQTLSDEQKAKWKKWSEECQAESGISLEAINKLRNNQFDGDINDNIKTHSLCFGKKSGLILENGDINVEFVRQKLKQLDNDEEVEKIIGKCVVKHDSQGDTAFHVFKCLREQKPKFSPV